MATLAEIENAIRVADAAGRRADVQALAAERERMVAKGEGNMIGDVSPQGVEPASLLQRIASNPTIKSLLETQQAQDLADPGKFGQAADDMARIGVDTASFGFADPAIGLLSGEDERAKTKAARERAGWAGTGMDVAAAVETAPAFITGKLLQGAKGVGAGVGRMLGYGAEGAGQAALSAVGHGERDPATLIRDAITGGALGAAGEKIGSAVGGWASRLKAKRAAAGKPSIDWSGGGPARAERTAEVEAATAAAKKGSAPEAFTPLKGKPGYSPEEQAIVTRLADRTLPRKAMDAVGQLSPFKSGGAALAHTALYPLTGGVSTKLGLGAEALGQVSKHLTRRDIEDLGALVRDPEGKGLRTDPETVAKVRDFMAKLMVSGERAGQ